MRMRGPPASAAFSLVCVSSYVASCAQVEAVCICLSVLALQGCDVLWCSTQTKADQILLQQTAVAYETGLKEVLSRGAGMEMECNLEDHGPDISTRSSPSFRGHLCR